MARRDTRKVDNLREMSDEDLAKELEEAHRQLFTSRIQLATRQLANTSLPRKTRQRLARIKTIQREREISSLNEAAAEVES